MPTETQPPPSAPNEIELYFHCAKCLEEKPPNVTPMDWSRTQAGWTKKGFQVWCNRHNCNVVHVDFMGQEVGRIA